MRDDIDILLQEKLYGYREEPPQEVSERIGRTLAGRSVSRRLWSRGLIAAGTAAAVALALLLPRPEAEMPPQTFADVPLPPADSTPVAVDTLRPLPSVEVLAAAIARRATDGTAPAAGSVARFATYSETPPATLSHNDTPARTPTEEEPTETVPLAESQPRGGERQKAATDDAYRRGTRYAPRNSYNPLRARGKGHARVAASLYAANSTGSPGVGPTGGPVPEAYRLTEVVTRSADRATTQHTATITSSEHRVPITFGMGIATGVSPRLSLETGINYTSLRSDFQAAGSLDYTMRQQLHYIGVPVALMWRFADAGPVNLYVRGGGMLEKGVKGTLRTTIPGSALDQTEDIEMKGLQPSLNASLGLQVELGGRVGLYLEPGVNFYPEMQEQPQSYRSENPLTFGIRAGLRFNLGK
jgi:hypothetical protein